MRGMLIPSFRDEVGMGGGSTYRVVSCGLSRDENTIAKRRARSAESLAGREIASGGQMSVSRLSKGVEELTGAKFRERGGKQVVRGGKRGARLAWSGQGGPGSSWGV